MPLLPGLDHNKALVGLGKSNRRNMLSCSLQRSSLHLCLLVVTFGAPPQSSFWFLPTIYCSGSHVLPLQTKIQGCASPPDYLARLDSAQAEPLPLLGQ